MWTGKPAWPGVRSEVLRIALLLVLLAVAASGSGFLARVDHLLFDVGQRLHLIDATTANDPETNRFSHRLLALRLRSLG